MPKERRQLSKEELEIQEILSPNKGSSSRQSSKAPGIVIRTSTGLHDTIQVHRPAETSPPVARVPSPEVKLPRMGLSDLSSLIRDSVVAGVKEGFTSFSPMMEGTRKRKRPQGGIPVKVHNNVNVNDNDDIDEDLPEVGLDAVLGETASPMEIFGVDVNESEYEDLSDDEDDPDNSYVPNNNTKTRIPPQVVTKDAGETLSSTVSPSGPADEPDPALPSVNPRLPASWHPNSKIIRFLKSTADLEWTKESRQPLLDKYHATEDLDEFLLPVGMPPKLLAALKSPAAKKKDYLFNRRLVETDLYGASSDICTSLRLLLEVYSQVAALPDSGAIRSALGHSIMGLCSANLKITRGRREVARRYVRLDWAEALYAMKPSHACMFGGSSLDEAMKAAKEASKADASLVFAPRKKRLFRPSYPTKDFQYPRTYNSKGGRFQEYRRPRQYEDANSYATNNNNNYNNNNDSRRLRGQSHRSRGRGRGSGSKRGSRPKMAYPQE